MNEIDNNTEEKGLYSLKKTIDIIPEITEEKTGIKKRRVRNNKESNESIITNGTNSTSPTTNITNTNIDIVKETKNTNSSLESPVNNKQFTIQVYEIVFYDVEKKEHKFYTYKEPEIKQGQLKVLDPFTSNLFQENILNKKVVTILSRKELNTTEIPVNLTTACMIKCVAEVDWMSRSIEEAKNRFDELVLKTYREVSEQITKVPVNNQINKHTVIPINKADHEALIGNLPVTEDRSHLVKGLD